MYWVLWVIGGCCLVVGRLPLQCCEMSLWLRGSEESKGGQQGGGGGGARPWLSLAVAAAGPAQLSCFLFSLCEPMSPYRRPTGRESRRPSKGFIDTATAAAAAVWASSSSSKSRTWSGSSRAQLWAAGHPAELTEDTSLIDQLGSWSTLINRRSWDCEKSDRPTWILISRRSSVCEKLCWPEVRHKLSKVSVMTSCCKCVDSIQ